MFTIIFIRFKKIYGKSNDNLQKDILINFFFTSSKKFEGIIDIQKDIYTLSKQ